MRYTAICALLCFAFHMKAEIVVDPPLTAAIIAQTDLLQGEFKTRTKHHNTIEIAQAGIVAAMEQVHNVEDQMLNYLANASNAMQNLYQLKKIALLVSDDIPNNLIRLGKDIPGNLKGTGITLFVNKTVTDTTTDILALSDIVTKLVTSKYSFKESKDKNDKNINLLSAAERYSILQDVLQRLTKINRRIFLTDFYIKTFGWKELWRGLDRESYCKVLYGEMVAKQLVQQWNNLLK